MQISILNGIYTDGASDFRTAYPRNLVPVPKQQGISQGYLRPAEGIVQFGVGPGSDRGGINWNNRCYRVMGTKLCAVESDGTTTILADVGGNDQVVLDYSFDRLAIVSAGRLFYWNGSVLTEVTDPDLGIVNDLVWVDGYFVTTDGTSLVVTELNDPTAVNPLKYGSSESNPDPILGRSFNVARWVEMPPPRLWKPWLLLVVGPMRPPQYGSVTTAKRLKYPPVKSIKFLANTRKVSFRT